MNNKLSLVYLCLLSLGCATASPKRKCPVDDYGYYTVKVSDTLRKIARKCGISVYVLTEENLITKTEDYTIREGDELYIPKQTKKTKSNKYQCSEFNDLDQCVRCKDEEDYKIVDGKCVKKEPSDGNSNNVNNSTSTTTTSNNNSTTKGCETFDINRNCLTCQKGYAFAKDTKNCVETALPSGCKEMDTNAKCTACNENFILQDGSCNKRIKVISNCAETVTDANGNTRCEVCQPLFIKDSNGNCIQGCPAGQFMIYENKDHKPSECSDGKNGVYKVRVADENNWNTFLSSKSGFGWSWNSFSKDASYGDGWRLRISGDNTLTTEDHRTISVHHEKYTSDGVVWRERVWTVKDHNAYNKRIILSTDNNGLTVLMKAFDGGVCMTNGPEESLKYGYTKEECQGANYSFKIYKA